MNKVYIVFAITLLLVSCTETVEYKKMYETVFIENLTPDTLLVKFRMKYPSNSDDTVLVMPHYYRHININNDTYDLWMTRKQLTAFFGELKIGVIESPDTVWIDRNYFSGFDDWTHNLHADYWFGTQTYFNEHSISINSGMYTKRN